MEIILISNKDNISNSELLMLKKKPVLSGMPSTFKVFRIVPASLQIQTLIMQTSHLLLIEIGRYKFIDTYVYMYFISVMCLGMDVWI